jgi:hypothetical protein
MPYQYTSAKPGQTVGAVVDQIARRENGIGFDAGIQFDHGFSADGADGRGF